MLHNCILSSTLIMLSRFLCTSKGKYLHENDSWKTFKHRSANNLPAKYSEVKAYFSLFVCLMSLVFLERQSKAQLWLRMNTFTLNSLCKKPIAYFWHCIFYLIQIDIVVHFTLYSFSDLLKGRLDILTDNNRNTF